MKRKSPKICVNFHGFDWISHYRGANKKSSFLALKEIDKKLEWLYKSAKKEGYDFYVFYLQILSSIQDQKKLLEWYETKKEYLIPDKYKQIEMPETFKILVG